jgi:uncharacterized membrane protein (DUF485 family)
MLSTEAIRQLPEYAALVRARQRIIWPLASATIISYFALILTIAFAPNYLGQPLAQATTSIGMALGLGMIVLCLILTGIYVVYANRVIEPLTQAIHKKAQGESL